MDVAAQPVTGARTDQPARPLAGDGDHERLAHYVAKGKIVGSAVTGAPVTALCGKVWVPSRDPSRFPVCPECRRLIGLGPRGRMTEWLRRQFGEPAPPAG